ncbi:MAG: translocation/assembly module TamB domain-containing protein [Deltaproteobacteria bacterium]|nr:translocation/assembly module TamB domain-containing protein [Deltaproteobacteria bacterium]
MKKLLKLIGLLFFILFGFIILFAFGFITWPQLYLNKYTIEKVQVLWPSFQVTAESFIVRSKSSSLLHKRLYFKFADLCFQHQFLEGNFSLCLPDGEADLEYSLKNFKLVSFGPVNIKRAVLNYTNLAERDRALKNQRAMLPDFTQFKLPAQFKNTRFEAVNVSFDKIIYKSPSKRFEGDMQIQMIAGDYHLNEITIKGTLNDKTRQNYALSAQITSPDFFATDQWKLSSSVDLSINNNQFISHINFDWDRRLARYELKTKINNNNIDADFSLSGIYSNNLVVLNVNAQTTGLGDVVKNVMIKNCKWQLHLINEESNNGSLGFSCPVELELKQYGARVDEKHVYQTPKQLFLDFKGDLTTFFDPDLLHETKGKIKAVFKSELKEIAKVHGLFNADFKGVPIDLPHDWKFASDLNVEASIEDFEQLVETLKGSKFSVWSPLDVLKGKTQVSIKGNYNSLNDVSDIPVHISTSLKSKEQELNIDSESVLKINRTKKNGREVFLDGELILTKVLIEIPNINPVAFPQISPDKRILLKTKSEKGVQNLPVKYNLKIKTTLDSPLKIKYYLAGEPVPVMLDIVAKNSGVSGKISVLKFPAVFFRRRATVDHLDLVLHEDHSLVELDGQVTVQYADYTIFIKLMGTVERPSLIFNSSPPLSKENIMSVLLYGEPYDELDFDQSASVNDAYTAMADKAISLFSLFALASTPIQRIGYNPLTKEFSAKFKLGKGTSLNLNKSDTKQQIGLQKRLGKGWLIRTLYEDTKDKTGQGKNNGTALIEWNKRY